MGESKSILRFLLFALAFVGILTLIVRLGKLRVRGRISYERGIGLTTLFVGVALLLWWSLTHGPPEQRWVQPLILPSPMEVLRSFKPLHFEQGLVLSVLSSWLRVTARFLLA